MTRSEKRHLRSKSKSLHDERLKTELPLRTRSHSFSIIHILQNNVDKKILISPYEKSVQKLIESRIIQKSIFWIVGPFFRIASHTPWEAHMNVISPQKHRLISRDLLRRWLCAYNLCGTRLANRIMKKPNSLAARTRSDHRDICTTLGVLNYIHCFYQI